MATARSSPALTCCVAGTIALLTPACVHRTASDATVEAPTPEAAPQALALSPEQVTLVQKNLRALDIPVVVTGAWDAQTEAGLIAFQKRHGFKPTGRLDADTRRELSLDPPSVAETASGGDPMTTRAPDDDRLRLAPPRHPDPQRGPAENLPEVPRDPSGSGLGVTTPTARANPQSHPGAFQACVDRELSRRGLNAFGDPPGTPARDVEDRYGYVTERYRDIATTCGTNRW